MNENIKNIAKIINSKCRFQNCNDCIKSEDTCWEFETAIALDKAGYRKQSETVKEFAEKLIKRLMEEVKDNPEAAASQYKAGLYFAMDLVAEYGKEEITEECKEECNETEKLYGVYGEDNEGVPCYNPNKIFSDIKMAKEYAILQKGKIAWGIAPVYEIFPKTVYEKVKKIDVRE